MVQLALVTRIREAATAYRAAPAGSSAAAFDRYLAALENLADYVGARWRTEQIIPDIAAARRRFQVKRAPVSRQQGAGRLIPFVKSASAGGSSPITAA
jgi:hypothetical protein